MSTRSCPRRSASARDTPPLVRVKSNWATLATGENPAPVRLRGSNEGVWWMRFHRPKRRQSASTSTWPPCAVAWSELVRRRCRVDLCFVNNGMDTHHHKGDVAASTISPAIAFLFTRLRIGDLLSSRSFTSNGTARRQSLFSADARRCRAMGAFPRRNRFWPCNRDVFALLACRDPRPITSVGLRKKQRRCTVFGLYPANQPFCQVLLPISGTLSQHCPEDFRPLPAVVPTPRRARPLHSHITCGVRQHLVRIPIPPRSVEYSFISRLTLGGQGFAGASPSTMEGSGEIRIRFGNPAVGTISN